MNGDVLKGKPRGTFDFSSDDANMTLITKWIDNSVVSVASNFDTIHKPVTYLAIQYRRKELQLKSHE
jgi:hypothetical protein